MISIAVELLAACVAAAVVAGLVAEASVRSAERRRLEELMTDLDAYVAARQSTK